DRVLLRRDHAAKAKVARRGLTREFPARDMALLDPHHAERLDAIRRYPEFATGLHRSSDQGVAETRRRGDLIGKFAREGEPGQPNFRPERREFPRGHMREASIGEIDRAAEQIIDEFARTWARDRILCPSVRHRSECDIEFRP